MNSLSKQKKSSRYTDIEASYKQVKNRRWKWNGILQIVKEPQVVAYIASVITILVAFFGTGFGENRWISGLVIVAGIIWIASGIYSMRSIFNKETKAIVSYTELHDLLTVARYEAEKSIINIGGDLSWLKQDISTLREIKDEHPDVKIKIFYDKSKLSEETRKLIAELQMENIVQLIPYPEGLQVPSIRCMVTDFGCGEVEDCRIYIYPKVEGEKASQHMKDKFAWQEYTYKTNPNLYNSVASLMEVLDSIKRHQIMVGISGLNNTGKTSIINKCKEKLQKNFSIRIVPDTFHQVITNKDFSYINRQIIFKQLSDLHTNYKEDIVIFDRTPFDNFIYLVMRETMSGVARLGKRKNNLFFEYSRMIREQMQNYDLVYNVKRKNETGDCSTKWVSAKERKCLISLYSEFSSEFLPRDIDSFEISGESFEKDVEEAASRLALYIQEYYFTGSDRYGC